MSRRFSKILVANRGEIACRIFRTAKELGYGTVAVYSDADANALHTASADEAVRIGPPAPADSYLNARAILDAAHRSGANAIHPGYGFLSENAEFSRACVEAGIVFIGPPADAIRAMGNKGAAKRLMIEAKVPCVPGYEGQKEDDATLIAEASKIGFPVLVKAAAGGGGRGMRRVHAARDIADAIRGARSEAKNAFGSDELIIERLVENGRHVEIQIIADEHGNCIHLGERDCSVQRRHQKIIEESPCPVLSAELREQMGQAAIKAAQAVGYVNAGTVEFLLDGEAFYFLEMNTRLQVEHPVTEMVTGWDLVAAQIAVAQGEELPQQPDPGEFFGHAIEVRLYAEDPARDFMPHTGKLLRWDPPGGVEGPVRVDHGIRSGDEITPHYDSMIAKIIASGESRADALAHLMSALDRTVVFGIKTNLELLQRIVRDPIFAQGSATTAYLSQSSVMQHEKLFPGCERLTLAAAILIERDAACVPAHLRGWRSTGEATVPIKLKWKGESYPLSVRMAGSVYTVSVEDEEVRFRVVSMTADCIEWESSGRKRRAQYHCEGDDLYLQYDGRVDHFVDATYAPPESKGGVGNGVLKAPMAGQIVRVNVSEGEEVDADRVLVVLEAMKMENQIVAPGAGVVSSLAVAVGDQVAANQVLLTITSKERVER